MNKQTHAILLVADISGYTQFMKKHAVSINHAKQIVVRLLKSLIKASKAPLKVAELEGDAVFFYAPCTEKEIRETTLLVKNQLILLFNSFRDELELIKNMSICNCDACVNAGDLKLKQVVHSGPIELEKIHKIEKLFGLDVIVVHRMLKNSVPSKEYLMITDEAFTKFEDFYGLVPEPRKENFEGIGEVDTVVFYPETIFNNPEFVKKEKKPPFIKRLAWLFRMGPSTMLELMGISKFKGTFKNIPS